jgi:hypothetical protein
MSSLTKTKILTKKTRELKQLVLERVPSDHSIRSELSSKSDEDLMNELVNKIETYSYCGNEMIANSVILALGIENSDENYNLVLTKINELQTAIGKSY